MTNMTTLGQTKTGRWIARKSIPKDVREAYQRLFKSGWETKFSCPKTVPPAEAKAKFWAWLGEIETRIETIRAKGRGEAQNLSEEGARALAGSGTTGTRRGARSAMKPLKHGKDA
jgi:hypothetical protein